MISNRAIKINHLRISKFPVSFSDTFLEIPEEIADFQKAGIFTIFSY